MRRISPNVSYLGALVLALGIVGYAILRMSGSGDKQGAASPLAMPEKDQADMRFHFLSAWQAVRVPKAARFDPPLGSEHGALVYNAQKYWEMNERRGGHHTGDDLNGIGGMNTDLGDPVFAIGDGLVVFSGEPSPGWGNIVVLAHIAPDGKPVHSMYAHLDKIEVTKDSLVARGGKIGTVGTANGHYPSHLHFEMRSSDGVDIGAGYSAQPFNRLDPTATIQSLRNSPPEGLSSSPLATAASR